MESFLVLLGRICDAVALASLSNEDILAKGWVLPGTDLSHIPEEDARPWSSHIAHCEARCDFRSISKLLMYDANTMLTSRAFRYEAWSDPRWVFIAGNEDAAASYYLQPASRGDWRALLNRFVGLDFATLDAHAPYLSDLLKYQPGGWLYAHRQIEIVRRYYAGKLAGVLDTTEFQLRPEASIDLLRQGLGLAAPKADDRRLRVADGYEKQYALTELRADVMFGRALASDRIDPPDKAPLAFDRLPAFVRRYLRNDLEHIHFMKCHSLLRRNSLRTLAARTDR